MQPKGFLQESNGDLSSMRLICLLYAIAFFGNAILVLWGNDTFGSRNPSGVTISLIYMVAASTGSSLQKIFEKRNGSREHANFLQEDGENYSLTRLFCILFCFFSLVLGSMTTYYSAINPEYYSDGEVFTLLSTLGAIAPKLLTKLIESKYDNIAEVVKDKLDDLIDDRTR